MSNIVWQKPGGGVAVTIFTPEALERMAWASQPELQALLEQKITLVAEAAALEVAVESCQAQLERIAGERQQLVRAAANELGLEAADLDGMLEADPERVIAAAPDEVAAMLRDAVVKQGLLVDLGAQQSGRNEERAAVAEKLATIEQLEHVRDSIGFDEHAHELVLKRRAQEHVDEMAKAGITVRPRVLDYVCVAHAAEIPADGTFRDAWVWKDSKIDHDLDQARQIHRDRIRAVRRPILEALDGKELAAQRKGDAQALADVRAQKQALCDAPADPAIDKAATVEDLKAAWPEAVKAHPADLVERAFDAAGLSMFIDDLALATAAAAMPAAPATA